MSAVTALFRLPPLGFCFGAAFGSGSESPACVSVKPCCVKVSRRLELGPDKSEAVQPSPHGELFVFLLLLLGACRFNFLCHFAKREAKLNVGLELPCVDSALAVRCGVVELEKSELDRALREGGVQVEHVM